MDKKEDVPGKSSQLESEKYRLKEPVQPDLVEALLEAGSEFMFRLTPQYEAVLAAIRMSQPEHLTKLNLCNSDRLQDYQLEWLLGGGNVKWLSIHGCKSLGSVTLGTVNRYGSNLEYLRIGDCYDALPSSSAFYGTDQSLKIPKLKALIVNEVCRENTDEGINWDLLLENVIGNLSELQIRSNLTFNNLFFLRAASANMTHLTLSNCMIRDMLNVWEPLFNLQNLKYLDVTGTRIEESRVGQNFLRRILSTMTNLTELYVDPGLVKNVDMSVAGQGSTDKRLEVLGLMDTHDDELGKANILAERVICFGSFKDELQILEYFSTRLNLKYSDPIIMKLVSKLNSYGSASQSFSVLTLLIKILKNNGVSVLDGSLVCSVIGRLMNPEPKIDMVLMDQMMNVICLVMEILPRLKPVVDDRVLTVLFLIRIMLDLEAKLTFDHYMTALPLMLSYAEEAATDQMMRTSFKKSLVALIGNTAHLLDMTVVEFAGQDETVEPWRISSVIAIIREFPAILQECLTEATRDGFVTSICNMIENVRMLCVDSVPQRKSFRSSGGIETTLGLLAQFITGSLKVSDRAIVPLLDILGSILQDTTLEKEDFDKITDCFETSIVRCFNQLEKDFYSETNVMKIIVSLLESAVGDHRFDYMLSAPVIKSIKYFNTN